MHCRVSCTLLCATFVFALSAFVPLAHAQTNTPPVDSYKVKLQQELTQLEAQIQQQQDILNKTQTQQVSLERDVAILNAQITQAELSIKARTISIDELTANISDKNKTIGSLNTKFQGELDSLAAILREKDQLDTTPLSVVILSSQDLSSFFSDVGAFDAINASIQQSFNDIKNTKQLTLQEKTTLQTQKDEETSLLQVQQLQQQQIQQQQQQKNQILSETKGQEKAYQSLIAKNQKSAADIRSELFQLTGSKAIPFGQALQYADLAEKKTGIRPAFLLGIIAEESNLGENVGTGTYSVDMSAKNIPIFLAITHNLGLDPNAMPVSKRQWYGYGGAMGPAQFIPSTWASYAGYVSPDWHYDASQDRIGPLTGDIPPNPWNPQDAFMAAALYLTDNGAGAQTPRAEFRAAMCYLAGCGGVNNPDLAFYGNSVAALAQKFQQEITIINGS